MIFNEINGTYYDIVSDIIDLAVDGYLTEDSLKDVVDKKGFAESIASIPDALKSKEWPFITDDYETPMVHKTVKPLTNIQKRWLKSLMSDPRIALFNPDFSGLEDVEPLYDKDTFVYFDRYLDGDPFEDPAYIENFRTILRAIKEKKKLIINYESGRGRIHTWKRIPYKIEYSSKDDKFRVLLITNSGLDPINISRIRKCSLLWEYDESEYRVIPQTRNELVLALKDERNALERVMLAFSDLEKETRKTGEDRYLLKLKYIKEDETEILIRVLSFGPVVKVIEPQSFINLIRERLNKQFKY